MLPQGLTFKPKTLKDQIFWSFFISAHGAPLPFFQLLRNN